MKPGMLRMLWVASALFLTGSAFAASPFDQLDQVQTKNEIAKSAADAESARIAEAKQAEAQAREHEQKRKQAAANQNANRKAAEAANARNAEIQRKRTRDEQFEDEARALALEEKKLDLEAKKAKVARSNDYIDAELKAEAAKTDVIQSEADATRDVSSGTKAILEKTGEADVNRSNKMFE